ncbi:MAG: DUF1189 family protein [Candidatus Woesearchaeota archaeon]
MAKDKIFGSEVKKEETIGHTFIKTIAHSLYPSKYPQLVSRTFRMALDYFFTLVFLSVFIVFLVSVYKFASFQYNLDKELEKFEKLEVKVDFKVSEPVKLGNSFVIDNERNYTNEELLITQRGVFSKPLLCILLQPVCLFDKKTRFKEGSSLSNVLQHKDALKRAALLTLVIMLPGLLLLFFAFYALKFLLTVFIAALVAFIVTRLSRYEVTFKQLILCAIYSSTILIIFEVLNLYFAYFYLIPLIAYIIMFTICIMLIGEREHVYQKKEDVKKV